MESAGVEPAISGLQDQRLPSLATTPKLSNSFDRSGGDRTHDIWFVRPALLPLSYAPKNLWLGDVDSNHDRQSQNLPSCQLDDLPIFKSRRWESNPQPAAYEAAAASFELRRHIQKRAVGIEPTPSSLENWRASGCASLARAATGDDETSYESESCTRRKKSGRQDLNLRPRAPETRALHKLSYALKIG